MSDVPDIQYTTVPISALEVEIADFQSFTTAERQTMYDYQGSKIVHGGKVIRAIIVDGQRVTPTGRFWESLFAKYGMNKSFFKYFKPEEIFTRLGEKHGTDRVRVCIETISDDDKRLLAVTGLNKPVIVYDDFVDIISQFKTQGKAPKISYSKGKIRSSHDPKFDPGEFKIGGDTFKNQFVIDAPIDGFGNPDIYLSMLRLICSNGMTAVANSFKTALTLGRGENTMHALRRAMESFSNDEGFAVMRDRFDAAQHSYASINEQQNLYKLLLGLQNDPKLRESLKLHPNIPKEDIEAGTANALLKAYERMTGSPYEMFGVDPNTLTAKRQRNVPVQCKMYDMMNFATELSTHYVSEDSARKLQAWLGTIVSNDYDLEGSCDMFTNFRDMFFPIQPRT